MISRANTIISGIGSFCYYLLMLAGFLLLTPLLYVVMLIDAKRLKASAQAVEPYRPDPPTGSFIDWILRSIGAVLAFLILPVIVLVGGFLVLFFPKDDEDDFG